MSADFKKIETVFLDFDYTLVNTDSWDVLCDTVLSRKTEEERTAQKAEFQEIKEMLEDGRGSFFEVLQRRIVLLEPTRDDIAKAAVNIMEKISANAKTAVDGLKAAGKTVRIIGGSVRELIEPVATSLGIEADHIDCNELDYDGDVAVAADMGNPLSQDGGKQYIVSEGAAPGTGAIVGSGPDDLEVKDMGGAAIFVAYTATRNLEAIAAKADKVITDLGELPGLFS